MKNILFSKQGGRFVPIISGLFFALLLTIPSIVYAMTVNVTVDSATHPVGGEAVVTATVVEGSPCFPTLRFEIVDGPNAPLEQDVNTVYVNGLPVSTFTYVSNGQAGVDTIEVYDGWCGSDRFSATVTWLDDSPTTVSPELISRPKLNVKKRGALTIAICNTNDFNVNDVDVKSVKLVGVEPVRSKFVDKDYCPGGEDGFVDLVFKFKNQKIVQALEEALGRELVDGEPIELDFTGNLKDADKTALDSKLPMQVFKKGRVKKHEKKEKSKHNKHEKK